MSNAPTNILDSVPLSDTGVPDREQRKWLASTVSPSAKTEGATKYN